MASFASIARTSGFTTLGISRSEGAPGIQPLPIATALSPRSRSGAGRIRSLGAGKDREEEALEPQGPPPPTHDELEAAQAAQLEAERALAAAQQELAELRGQLEVEQSASRDLAACFERAAEELEAEMRSAFADLVLHGCRRLMGSLSESDAVFHSRLDTVSEQLVLETDVVLRVSPKHKRAAETAIFGRMGWSVEVDPEMEGGCVAVCRNSLVDARLETAFDGMEQALRAWLSQDGPGVQSK
jgi:flagellar biosynthesis/type III secretory pathway protein FliH